MKPSREILIGLRENGTSSAPYPIAGWGQFQQMCVNKAACAGRVVLFVNPRYTSQVCSTCGTVRKKSLEERWHSCECGCELDRDTNAAVNILRLGRSQRGATCVEAPCRRDMGYFTVERSGL